MQDGAKRDRMRRRKGETGRGGEVEWKDREKRNTGKGEGGEKVSLHKHMTLCDCSVLHIVLGASMGTRSHSHNLRCVILP